MCSIATNDNINKIWLVTKNESYGNQNAGVGIILHSPEREEITYFLRFEFKATTNQAEYEAFIVKLKLGQALWADRVKIQTDSQLIANHLNIRSVPIERSI